MRADGGESVLPKKIENEEKNKKSNEVTRRTVKSKLKIIRNDTSIFAFGSTNIIGLKLRTF